LDYDAGVLMTEEANWQEGTYRVGLTYHNGKADVNVPQGTGVRVTINRNQFVPARTNDLIFMGTVGTGGVLEIRIPAKSLLEGGLPFSMESSFIADFIEVTAGVETASKYVFSMNTTGVIYGGETNNANPVRYTRGARVEQPDVTATWKNATYTVRLRWRNDLTSSDLRAIPENARITIKTTNRQTIDASLRELTEIRNGSQANPLEFTFLAPDPALSATPLAFQIHVDFIARVTENAAGDQKDYKFHGVINSNIWGGINKRFNDGDNEFIVTGTPL
jgi:hypothetical protein